MTDEEWAAFLLLWSRVLMREILESGAEAAEVFRFGCTDCEYETDVMPLPLAFNRFFDHLLFCVPARSGWTVNLGGSSHEPVAA